MDWFASKGAHIYVPVVHSPDVDLVAEIERMVLRIEVKTATHRTSAGRWDVQIATRGGNQSWNRVTKYFDHTRCDYLFVHVGDGRRWFIPSGAIEGRTGLSLGGPKYSRYEVERGRPLLQPVTAEVGLESTPLGECPSGQRERTVNAPAQPTEVRILPPPLSSPHRVKPTNYERKPGQRGEAVINQKRRLTIPQGPFFEAGFENGGRVRVRAIGPGRMLVEQIQLPDWSKPAATDAADKSV